MTEPNPDPSSASRGAPGDEVAAIEADLEQTRQRLGETIDALGDKLDVKTRATRKAGEVRDERGTELAVAAGVVVALVVVWVVSRRRR